MKHALSLLRSWFATFSCLLMAMAFCASAVQAQLTANPDDFKIKVKWRQGIVIKNDDRLGGPAEIILDYNPPSGPDISSVQARLMEFELDEVLSLPCDGPPPLWQNDDDRPTMLEPELDENGTPTGLLGWKIPWNTRSYHNGPQRISAKLQVTVRFTNGQTQILEYPSILTPIVRNLTVDDLTGIAPVPSVFEASLLGEPTAFHRTVPPAAEPAFIWPQAQGGPKVFRCALNSALPGAVRLRYELFSCDDPDTIIVRHETGSYVQGLDEQGQSRATIATWEWDGTKTVEVWQGETSHPEQVPVGRGLYQVRITAEIQEDSGEGYGSGYGSSMADSDSTRSTRTCWPAFSMYSPAINLAYNSLLEGGKRQLNVNYALRLSGETLSLAHGVATRLEAFTRVYDPAPGPLERVGDVVEGPAQTDVINPSLTLNQAELQVPWNDKANRAEKVLLTANDQANFDRGHREKWNLGQTRKVIDGEAESVIYQVTTPATATAPEGLRRITNNQIVGGKCYVGLEVEISAGGYLSNRFFSLKLTEDPDSGQGVTHPGAQDHIYFLLSASSPDGASSVGLPGVSAANQPRWQLWNPSLEKWQDALQSPQHHRSANRERWRVLIPWQTATSAQMPNHGGPYNSTLLGHNGPHTFKVKNVQDSSLLIQDTSTATFACDELTYGNSYNNYAMSHSVEIDKATDKANVHNVVITSCKAHDKNEAGVTVYNPDYLKFDPESTDALRRQPKITFKVEDLGDPHRYRWWLWLKPTREEQNSVELTGIMDGPGEKTITINPTTPEAGVTQDHDLTAWGTYTFELRVQEIENNSTTPVLGAWQELRSARLFIPTNYTHPQTGAWTPGHTLTLESEDLVDDQSQVKAKVSYYLEDTPNQGKPLAKDANIGKVQYLDGIMQEKSFLPLKPEIRTPREDELLHTLTEADEAGEFRAIIMAEDAHAMDYRDHKNKRMIPANQKGMMKSFHIEDDWMTKGSPYTNDYLNPLAHDAAVIGAFMRPDNPKLTTPWPKSKIIWLPLTHTRNGSCGAVYAGNGGSIYHFLSGETGPTGDYETLRVTKNYVEKCNDYSSGATNPHFDHFLDRNGPSSSQNKAHDLARYAHVVGAGSILDQNGNVPANSDLYGLTAGLHWL
ncbi:MAG TPA: hypothetical protein VGB77_06515, partial [Abditibacteriaceae bacterium]